MSAQLRFNYSTSKDPPQRYLDKVGPGIKKAAKKWGLTLDPSLFVEPGIFQLSKGIFQWEGRQSTRFGNHPIAPGTKENYEGVLRQDWRICTVIGDYDSMLLLLSPCPDGAPSQWVKTLDVMLRFKRQTPGIDLLQYNNRDICTDVFNNLMTVEGHWKAPKNAPILGAAVHALHVAQNHVAEYQEPCGACRGRSKQTRHKGCPQHNDVPHLYRKGDPTSHSIFLNCKEQLRKDDIAYEENGSCQLLPSDLRLLRARLLSSKNIVDLQTWVIIINACLLFLRHDEFHEIEMKHFKEDLFQILEDQVNSLALEVFGKSDRRWLKRRLVADHLYTELCPVRPLLVYKHLIGIKGGYLFPSAAELQNPPADGIYKTVISYSVFMAHLQNLCEEVLPARDDMKIGCQTFRKTGYLLAIFGDGNSIDLKKSARHATDVNSAKYRKDAEDLYRMHKENPNPANNVGKWKPIQIEGNRNAKLMASFSGHRHVAFKDLGDHFVRNILKIPENHVMARDPIFLVRAAGETVKSSCSSELFRVFKESLNARQAEEIQKIFDSMIRDRVQAMLQDENTARSLALLPVASSEVVAASGELVAASGELVAASGELVRPREEVAVGQPPSKRACVRDSLQERSEIKGSDTRTKINIMKGLWDQRESWEKPLTSGAKTFNNRFLTPAMNCLERHCGGSVDTFVEKYPAFEHTKFHLHCTGGKGASCTPK
jgi:hypothetical protein